MKFTKTIKRCFSFLRCDISIPNDIAKTLGMDLSVYPTFNDFINQIASTSFRPLHLKKYMPRNEAEEVFQGAFKKECFHKKTMFSYFFNDGWMEFVLSFDEQSRLRRVFVLHKKIAEEQGVEIHLTQD